MVETRGLPDLVARVMAELRREERVDVSPPVPGGAHGAGEKNRSAGGTASADASEVDRLATAAKLAQERWHQEYDIERRSGIIGRLRADLAERAEELARLSLEETGMGNRRDKIAQVRLAIARTPGPEYFTTKAVSGDNGLMLEELSPFGVVASLCPSTNPAASVINNAICMIAAGDAVIFGAHPKAVRSTLGAVELVNRSLRESGAPFGLVSALTAVSPEALRALMAHRFVRLIAATGGADAVAAALSAGKPAIGAGPGNPPVLVDETARLEQAAKDIVAGCSFDNNLPCFAEKELLVVHCVADELKRHMRRNGAYELADPEQIRRLESLLLTREGRGNGTYVGKDAAVILEAIGVRAPEETRIVLVETAEEHPFAQEELRMPVLPLIRVPDFEAGLAMAKRLEHGLRHSAGIHSRDVDHLSAMAREMETALFVKNAPFYAAVGVNSQAPVAFTIATATGQGATTPLSYCRTRRCVLHGAFRIV